MPHGLHPMAEYKLDIFKLIKEISKKNIAYYDTLSDEEKKAFAPLIVSRWLSGIQNKQQVYLINAIVNPFLFDMSQHKKLLYYLMTICTNGKDQKYTWNKLPSKKNVSKPISTQVVSEYFNYSTKDAVEALKILSPENILLYADELGKQPDEISKIKKELKDS